MGIEDTILTQITVIDWVLLFSLIALGIVSGIIAKFIINKLSAVAIYPWIRKHSPESYRNTTKAMSSVSEVIKWIIIVIFFFQALSVFNIFLFNEVLKQSINFLPRLGIVLIILIFGFIITHLISEKIRNMNFKHSELISKIAGFILISATVLAALEHIGAKITPFMDLFRAITFALAATAAIAIGIGVGLAIKPIIGKMIKEGNKKSKK